MQVCCVWKEKLENKYAQDENIVELEVIIIIQVNIEVLHIAYLI